MLRRIVLPTILLVLAWGLWSSPDLKQISAGVAIFLFGMLALEQGFRAFTGGALERLLKRTTNRLWKSLAFGTVATTVMQSSSLVSVITISFLSAGLISLVAGIGIVFGANLGTTTGAWLVAGFGLKVDLASYAMPMLVFGVIFIFQKSKTWKGVGYVLAGIGFLFLGIHHMKDGFEAFKQGIDLSRYAMAGYPGLFVFVLVGIAATVVMQSSHATLVLVITALAAGQVTYENALALAIGSNIGTTITAILGSMSSNIQGTRLAAAHLIFNAATGMIAIAAIHPLVWIVDWTSATLGIANSNYTLKLAVFHTIFNAVGIIIMVPFISRLAELLERRLQAKEPAFTTPKFLNDAAIGFADSAIEATRLETVRLYRKATKIIAHGLGVKRKDALGTVPLEELDERGRKIDEQELGERYTRSIKSLYGAIVEYISRAQQGMQPESANRIMAIRFAGRQVVEAVKDMSHLQKNFARYSVSDNEHLRAAYRELRARIVRLIRQLESLRQGSESEPALLTLEKARVDARRDELVATEKLDSLIRSRRITAAEATSLINDNGYAFSICNNLITMWQILFAAPDHKPRDPVDDLVAMDDEVAAFPLHQAKAGPQP